MNDAQSGGEPKIPTKPRTFGSVRSLIRAVDRTKSGHLKRWISAAAVRLNPAARRHRGAALPTSPRPSKMAANIRPPLQTTVFQHLVQM
jgi:hypothetical protein